jgi:hypothetical protein
VRRGVLEVVGEHKLEALLLGGGYGRGEGGVLRTPQGHLPYNDLEFYVLLRGSLLSNRRAFQHRLHELGEKLSHDAGLEVELKVFSARKLRESEVSMFFYDLFMGHRLVHGTEQVLAGCDHHAAADRIPLHEATRLLMNRCSGLLFAAERLGREEFGPQEADFVNRNLHKLRLALGDAILTSFGQYHWSCRERHQRLQNAKTVSPWHAEILAQHARGTEFKLHPFRSSQGREELRAEHAELSELAGKVWLWLESKRLGLSFHSAREYANSSANKWPDSPAGRNVLLNLVHARTLRSCWQHPRARVLHALTLLLWTPLDVQTLAAVQKELRVSSKSFPELVSAYQFLWSKVN